MLKQEPITRSLQLPHIPVTVFPQTELFLVWIYLDFRSHKNLIDQMQSQARNNVACRRDVDMFTWGRIILSFPKHAHVDWLWPISREKI